MAEDIMVGETIVARADPPPGSRGRAGKKLFLQDDFELVPDERTDDEDDEEEEYFDEDPGRSQDTEIKTHPARVYILRGKHENDPEHETDDRAVFQQQVIVFFSLVQKSKNNTQGQVQYLEDHNRSLGYGNITPVLQKGYWKILQVCVSEGMAGTIVILSEQPPREGSFRFLYQMPQNMTYRAGFSAKAPVQYSESATAS